MRPSSASCCRHINARCTCSNIVYLIDTLWRGEKLCCTSMSERRTRVLEAIDPVEAETCFTYVAHVPRYANAARTRLRSIPFESQLEISAQSCHIFYLYISLRQFHPSCHVGTLNNVFKFPFFSKSPTTFLIVINQSFVFYSVKLMLST